MRRVAITAGTTGAALLLMAGIGVGKIDRYKATGLGGSPQAGLEFNAKIVDKHPKKVLDLEWFNVPCSGGGAANGDKQDWTIRVHDDKTFSKTHAVDNTLSQTVTITGQFKHHNTKVPGTFKLTGGSPGCFGGTGTFSYTAHN